MPKKFIRSVHHASRGLWVAFKEERNIRLHSIAAAGVIAIAWGSKLNATDWMVLVVLITMIFSAELVNSTIERICDILRDRYHLPYEGSRDIRDIAAGVVWVQAIAATIIGGLLLVKYW